MEVLVIGAGVAGCAAAVAAAEAGARVVLAEAGRHLGGVAAAGEHRTLCGLAPIDAPHPQLLEAQLTARWLPAIATGEPYRQGRVWLWPCDAAALQRGLRQRLDAAAVEVRLGARVVGLAPEAAGVPHRIERVRAEGAGGGDWRPAAVIDASGEGAACALLGLAVAGARQWPSHRSVLRLPGLGHGRAERVRALADAQAVLGGGAAIALTPLPGQDQAWQLSLDVPPDRDLAGAADAAAMVADALGGELLACACRVAHRDRGRPAARLGLVELFAERERGLCWAAWPREEHLADGVAWTWPPADRHGVPEAATRPLGGPANLWCVGKGMPVSAEAAAALRVTGTCLALGAAVGDAAARWVAAQRR